jgi:hypothetical protein
MFVGEIQPFLTQRQPVVLLTGMLASQCAYARIDGEIFDGPGSVTLH